MIKIKMIANLSYQTPKLNSYSDYETFISKNNDSKNWGENQKPVIIIDQNDINSKRGLNVSNANKLNVNNMLLNNNVRNNDGHLHLVNVTIYVMDSDIDEFERINAQTASNEYFKANPFSNGIFNNITFDVVKFEKEMISKLEALMELTKKVPCEIVEKMFGTISNLASDEIYRCVSKTSIDAHATSEEEFYDKHHSDLENNIELSKEVRRIFNTKNEYKVQYASYYFENEKIYKKNVPLLVEALYVAGRIDRCEYFNINISLDMITRIDMNSYLQFMNQLMSMTSGLFIHFNLIEDNWKDTYIDKLLLEIKKMQYSTICNFSICGNSVLLQKNLIEDLLYNNFKIVAFKDVFTKNQAMEYVNSYLKNNNMLQFEPSFKKIIETEYDNNKVLDKNDIENIYHDIQKKIAHNVYGKEYTKDRFTLDAYIGLNDFKLEVGRVQKQLELSYKNDRLRMGDIDKVIKNRSYRFEGESGVGKTMAANILTNILWHKGLISSEKPRIVYSLANFMKNYELQHSDSYSETIKHNVENMGFNVLLIENLHQVEESDLIDFLDNLSELKKQYLIIVCGTKKEFEKFDKNIKSFKGKFPRTIKFDEYTTSEMIDILNIIVKENNYEIDESAFETITKQFEKAKKVSNFGNAIFVKNYAESIMNNSLNRVFDNDSDVTKDCKVYTITDEDINSVDMMALLGNEYGKIDTYENSITELDRLIGLMPVKNYIKSYLAKSKIDEMKREKGFIKDDGYNMHLCFTGSPGTAKTTVARQFAKILYINGIISKPDIVECGLSDLQGEYLGQTSPKVIEKFEEAKGGVLFIDEAYSLNNDDTYSRQAIDTIVAQMENHRDEVIVIFAGYREPMEEFIRSNPGLKGRVSRFLDFPDYSLDELMQIFDKMLDDGNYILEDEISTKEYVRKCIEEKMSKEDFANGREVRLLVENAIINQSMRLYNDKQQDINDYKELMTLKHSDFVDEINDFYKEKNKIGFAV